MSPPDRPSTVPPLGDGECQVWASGLLTRSPPWVTLLDRHERERWERFRRDEARDRYLTAHALARVVLGAHAGLPAAGLRFDRRCARCGRPHGKPGLIDADLEFSLSHAGGLVLVAVTRGVPVGVDVERSERGNPPLDRALTATERAVLERLPAGARGPAFIRYWTRKEALLKATGDGLSVAPGRLAVSAPDEPPRLLAWDADRPPEGAFLADLRPDDGYVATVAFIGSALRVSELDAGALLAAREPPTGPEEPSTPSPRHG